MNPTQVPGAAASHDAAAPAGVGTARPTGAVAPRVRFDRVAKQYPNGVRACVDVTIEVEPGTVHAVVGENGAGKSTLMKMLYGMEQPTQGELLLDGVPTVLRTSQDAIGHGIGMVHQSFMLVPTFTIAQNIVLGSEPMRRGMVDRRRMIADVAAIADDFGLQINPTARAQDVSVGMLQRAEILKALYRGARVLVLDEPTAVLTPQETTELFRALRAFASSGRSVLFISHKLREVLAVADTISVMRGGRKVGQVSPGEVDQTTLATMMVGRDVVAGRRHPTAGTGPERLVVRGLSCANDLRQAACRDISLTVQSGEIVCLVGVEGNGQTELIEAIAGLRELTAGTVDLDGVDVGTASVAARRSRGLGHIPEDRMKNGVALAESIEDNLIVDRFRRRPFRRGPFQRVGRIRLNGEQALNRFAIRAADARVPVGGLSGGNIQKVIVARELGDDVTVLLAAQPTRGVDVGAMEFIHAQLRQARDRGAGVLLVSADLTEALTLADRVLVMRQGHIVAAFDEVDDLTDETLGVHMLGAAEADVAESFGAAADVEAVDREEFR